MASYNEEKQGLTGSFKSQMGYGTAPISAASKKVTPKTQKFINKKLNKTDTLQGIALRYGVTVQDLKRENRLYTNDSLFLRQTLLIPLTADNHEDLGPDDHVVVIDGSSGKLLAPKTTARSSPGSGSDSPLGAPVSTFSSSSPLPNGGSRGAGDSSPAVLQVHNELTGVSVECEGVVVSSSSSSCDPHTATSRTNSASSASSSSETTATSTSKMLPPPSSSSPSSSSSTSSSRNQHQRQEARAGVNGKESSGATAAGGGPSLGASGDARCSSPGDASRVISSATVPPTDFFSKYDQNIAFLKGEIARLENNATNLDGLMEANPLSLPARKGSQTSASGWNSYQVSDDEVDGAPVLLIRSRTNTRQVKSTIERSQQASDDLFEL